MKGVKMYVEFIFLIEWHGFSCSSLKQLWHDKLLEKCDKLNFKKSFFLTETWHLFKTKMHRHEIIQPENMTDSNDTNSSLLRRKKWSVSGNHIPQNIGDHF